MAITITTPVELSERNVRSKMRTDLEGVKGSRSNLGGSRSNLDPPDRSNVSSPVMQSNLETPLSPKIEIPRPLKSVGDLGKSTTSINSDVGASRGNLSPVKKDATPQLKPKSELVASKSELTYIEPPPVQPVAVPAEKVEKRRPSSVGQPLIGFITEFMPNMIWKRRMFGIVGNELILYSVKEMVLDVHLLII